MVKHTGFFTRIMLAVFLCACLAGSAFAEDTRPSYVEGDAIVVFKLPAASSANTITATSIGGQNKIWLAAIAEAEDFKILETYDGLSALSVQNAQNAQNAKTANLISAVQSDAAEPGIFTLVHSDTLTTEKLLEKLSARSDVLAVSPNPIAYPASVEPSEPAWNLTRKNGLDYFWALKAINVPEVWEITTGSDDIYIAVNDTGVDYTHPDLEPNFSRKYSKNFKGSNASGYADDDGHGTMVAGVIAARENGLGTVGVLWRAKLISLRWGSNANGDVLGSINGLATILSENPDLKLVAVNMSYTFALGKPDNVSNEKNATWLAYHTVDAANRTMLVAAAGNDERNIGKSYEYPASFKNLNNLLTVGAANTDKSKASFSNYSTEYVHLAAPGVYTITTCIEGEESSSITLPDGDTTRLAFAGGTSLAAPYVAGAVGLLKAACPTATIPEIRTAICTGADTNHCTDFTKYGFLDIKGAYDELKKICDAKKNASQPLVRDGGNVELETDSITTYDGDTIKRAQLALRANFTVNLGTQWSGGAVYIERQGSEKSAGITVGPDGDFEIQSSLIKSDDDEFEVFVRKNSDESEHVGLVLGDGLFWGEIALDPDSNITTGTEVTMTANWVNKFESVSLHTRTSWKVSVGSREYESYTGKSYTFTPSEIGTHTVKATGSYLYPTLSEKSITRSFSVTKSGTDPVDPDNPSKKTGSSGSGGCSVGLGLNVALLAVLVLLYCRRQ